ncbi:MAG TPA: ABC transporter ATP-binding protein, partial [Candidatus Angelobacter sp.]|nr:ABC transporter ATP-binding protein [Candidatus Angelobacter sp.]
MADPKIKKKTTLEQFKSVLPQIWELVLPRWPMLLLGFFLLMIKSVAGLALPFSTKILVDEVVNKNRITLLMPLVLGVLAATLIQAATSFTLTQLLSKEGQRVIAQMRRRVQAHVSRLPVSYYDSNKSGALVARIMTDVEGVRNLIGTGQMEFVGGLLTATIVLGVMFYINYVMTAIALGGLL